MPSDPAKLRYGGFPDLPVAPYEEAYDSLNNGFVARVLDADDPALLDPKANIGCAYRPGGGADMVELPRPVAAAGEVIIHVQQSGICGSDLHMFRHGANGSCVVTKHTCAGHESAGEVVELGEGVDTLKVGDRVAIECCLPCLSPACGPCIEGRYNLCPRIAFLSAAPFHGTLARYVRHPAAWVHKLPDNVSTEEGSLCEPLVVVLAALDRAGVKLGDSVLICGAGPIGIMALLAARAAGCEPITITDLVASRLEFAKKLVPSVKTVLVERGEDAGEVAKRARAAAGGVPARVALEATGFESSIHAAIYGVDHGGKVYVLGMGAAMQTVPFTYLQWREIDLQYQYLYANQYPKAIRLVAGGLVDVGPLVTHRFPLKDALKAFEVALDPAHGAIKVQIQD
ncbi:L-arabinitol 4-dehydrogenase [Vanrija pseudolonga]|uniref:L-arabinitol 4-dehydrogenase n=1 Tax=Vanrija pseudolonga TaxID=143232 RepID=A0AAF1BJF7_9TREE|nr:L-arabinitol 4-dehydrogenase [Vanrija pseudolonga]